MRSINTIYNLHRKYVEKKMHDIPSTKFLVRSNKTSICSDFRLQFFNEP